MMLTLKSGLLSLAFSLSITLAGCDKTTRLPGSAYPIPGSNATYDYVSESIHQRPYHPRDRD